ncbi:response regulator transcription factor [Pseudofrankia sp. BMG5.37]|uniref:response regulator transcription factor n=1 Tax=Pseudofrankia sp. BMG5.37 TaxID=3050035 RepID=UPI002896132E|nr:response regulator transcription factor [Pseudofrankia sp. BMG5.37]MDT3441726.1 response regulator transcription factor [Pseudofrankia sp. BMG5.37]
MPAAPEPADTRRPAATAASAPAVAGALAPATPPGQSVRFTGAGHVTPAGTAASPGQAAGLVLIADADPDDELVAAFDARGFKVRVVSDGALALLEAGRLGPDTVLVSATLPVLDGIGVVRALRAMRGRGEMTILLGLGPDDRAQAAAGLEAGASACVAKPYLVSEVLALAGPPADAITPAAGTVLADGMHAAGLGVASWVGGRAGAGHAGEVDPEVFRVGTVTLDIGAHQVRVDGVPVAVPPREFRLLRVLLERAGRVVPRESLLELVWGTSQMDSNTLAVHVRRLRRRLGDTAETPWSIESVRGVGYRYRLP